jgi:hypothetical protein
MQGQRGRTFRIERHDRNPQNALAGSRTRAGIDGRRGAENSATRRSGTDGRQSNLSMDEPDFRDSDAKPEPA